MKSLIVIPLVDWGMGAVIIGVFAVVCVVIALVVYNMAKAPKNNENNDKER